MAPCPPPPPWGGQKGGEKKGSDWGGGLGGGWPPGHFGDFTKTSGIFRFYQDIGKFTLGNSGNFSFTTTLVTIFENVSFYHDIDFEFLPKFSTLMCVNMSIMHVLGLSLLYYTI